MQPYPTRELINTHAQLPGKSAKMFMFSNDMDGWVDRERERERERQRDRETERQRDRETERERGRPRV